MKVVRITEEGVEVSEEEENEEDEEEDICTKFNEKIAVIIKKYEEIWRGIQEEKNNVRSSRKRRTFKIS